MKEHKGKGTKPTVDALEKRSLKLTIDITLKGSGDVFHLNPLHFVGVFTSGGTTNVITTSPLMNIETHMDKQAVLDQLHEIMQQSA